MAGWVKIHRKFLTWEWFNEPNMAHVFLYFLLKANYEPKRWRGIVIGRGQFVAGIDILSENLGISKQSIRTCLKKLKSTSEITIKSTNKYSIITICKYDDFKA